MIKWILRMKMKLRTVNISEPVLQNMVVACKYNKSFRLHGRPSNAQFFYETEIFPAALIRRWAPAHIALFPSGSLLCTGIREWRSFNNIIRDLSFFLNTTNTASTTTRNDDRSDGGSTATTSL